MSGTTFQTLLSYYLVKPATHRYLLQYNNFITIIHLQLITMCILMALAAFIPIIGKVLDSIFPDKEKASQAKLKVLEMQMSGEMAGLDAQTKIIVAEANSDHALAAIWRPIIMLMFGFIIFNNFILYPYLSLFVDNAPILDIPVDLWDLIKIGLGGYVIGRSSEKIITKWKK